MTQVISRSSPTTQYKVFLPKGPRGLQVLYQPEMDGGGTHFGQEYVPILKEKYPGRQFKRCYEWCSGPGFIGYAILDHRLCQSLCLTDLYDPSVTAAEQTATLPANACQGQVSVYLLKDLALLPAHEMFDLVVSNPPHFESEEIFTKSGDYQHNRICTDYNWLAHKNFFANIKKHLLPGGVILLQENQLGSTPETFRPMAEAAGLKITDSYPSRTHFDNKKDAWAWIYYIEIQHA